MRFLGAMLAGTDDARRSRTSHFIDEATHDLLRRLFEGRADRRRGAPRHPLRAPTRVARRRRRGRIGACSLTLLPLSDARRPSRSSSARPRTTRCRRTRSRRSRGVPAGNPLFLFELLDAVRATGLASSRCRTRSSRSIAGEIDRLSPTDRTILRYASVLGASFDPDAAGGRGQRRGRARRRRCGTRLSALVDARTRRRPAVPRTRSSATPPTRASRTAGGASCTSASARRSRRPPAIRVEEEVATLALHFYEAQRWDKAWRYCRLAGDRAMRVYANVDAGPLLRAGLDRRSPAAVRPRRRSRRGLLPPE